MTVQWSEVSSDRWLTLGAWALSLSIHFDWNVHQSISSFLLNIPWFLSLLKQRRWMKNDTGVKGSIDLYLWYGQILTSGSLSVTDLYWAAWPGNITDITLDIYYKAVQPDITEQASLQSRLEIHSPASTQLSSNQIKVIFAWDFRRQLPLRFALAGQLHKIL